MSNVPTLKQALADAHAMGLEVRGVRRTGEVAVWDPVTREKAVMNVRKKDASRSLMLLLKHAREARKNPPREWLAYPSGKLYWSCHEPHHLRRDHPACSRREGHAGAHMNQWGNLWPRRPTDESAPPSAPEKSAAD